MFFLMSCWFVSKSKNLQMYINKIIVWSRNQNLYKNIVLLKRGKMHKMHKKNKIMKNSCEGTKRATTLRRIFLEKLCFHVIQSKVKESKKS
jgi:hypothetical protein